MIKKENIAIITVNLIYAILAIVSVLYACFGTDMIIREKDLDLTPWSQEWEMDGDRRIAASEALAQTGQTVTISKQLPETIGLNDSLCFISHNSTIKVYIDGRQVYEIIAEEGFTGYGYGDRVNEVVLNEDDAGKEVSIEIGSVFQKSGTGHVEKIYIGSFGDYSHLLIKGRILPAMLSFLIIFFGLLLIAAYIFVPQKDALPYDLVALGLTAILLGLWSVAGAGILQIVTGSWSLFRVISYLTIPFAAYPMTGFVNSFLVRSQRRNQYVMFAMWSVLLVTIFSLRFIAGIDMHNMIAICYVFYAISFGYMIFMVLEDRKYCRQNGIERDSRYFFYGAACAIVGAVIEMTMYFASPHKSGTMGTFLRIGVCCFIFEMMIQFLYWWVGERELMARNGFVNSILQYSVASDDPEKNIEGMLEFLGKKLEVDRAYIFERLPDGAYANTYEWCAEGVASVVKTLDHVPFDGFISKIYDDIDKEGHAIIRNVKELEGRAGSEGLYQILNSRGIKNTVAGPIEAGGVRMGMCGVENIRSDTDMTEVSEIIRLLSYFFGQLIMQRENNNRLRRYSYTDMMTGMGNRRAFEKYEKEDLDKDSTYGYVMCDINGLKTVNDTLGHEAGDEMIKDVAEALIAVFGKENSYRMGGDEFTALSFDRKEEELKARIDKARDLITAKGRSASIGYVFCENGSIPYEVVKVQADKNMYYEKGLFYSGKNERRERRG